MQSKRKKRTKPKISIKTFTVTDTYYPSQWGGGKIVPFIRLRGEWLNKIGFKIGQKLKVIISKKRLVIIPKKKNEL